MKHINIVLSILFILIFLSFIVCDIYNFKPMECSEYSDHSLRDIPARCLSFYQK